MSYIFTSFATVPAKTITEIGADLIKHSINKLSCSGKYSVEKIDEIQYYMTKALQDITAGNSIVVDGWQLSSQSVSEISEWLKIGKRIEAIKEFRRATGCALREGKLFIDKFPLGVTGATEFMNTFQGGN